jgi:hypothetical protein
MRIEFPPGQSATVCVLDGARQSLHVTLIHCDGRRLSIHSAAAFERGTPVRIEWGRYLLLGEVGHEKGEGVLNVQIRHALDKTDVASLQSVWQ